MAEMFFFLTITAVKLSILDFYRHIFATKKFCITAHVISVICVLWLLAGILYNILDCDPIEANYVVTYPTLEHCAPFGIYFFFHELLNSLIDVAILAMPCVVIRRLRLTKQQKVQVIGVFLLGGLYVSLGPMHEKEKGNEEKLTEGTQCPHHMRSTHGLHLLPTTLVRE